jgi:type I restriction enzyme S subunit
MTGQGSVGRVGKIRILDSKKILLNQRVGKFAVDNINLDNNYLYYIISSPLYESILFNAGTGSGQPNLSPQDILSVEIPYPDIKEQKAIAATLSALDDMIELNNQINKTLEEMAQAIFKSWFVDFEPFKNGEFEESELGLIPKGWRVGAIDELIKETISGDWGKETPQGNYTEKVICIRGADIPDIAQGRRGNPATRYILKRNLEKKRLSENEIIIEISVASFGKYRLIISIIRIISSCDILHHPLLIIILTYIHHKTIIITICQNYPPLLLADLLFQAGTDT